MREIRLPTGEVVLVDADLHPILVLSEWRLHSGYAVEMRTKTPMHRAIVGADEGQIVDHKNRNRLDNRRENLRIVTASQNAQNRKPKTSAGKYKGLSPYEGGWQVHIRSGRERIFVGKFYNEQRAAAAYDVFAKLIHGEYAMLNFPIAPPPVSFHDFGPKARRYLLENMPTGTLQALKSVPPFQVV